MKKILPFLLLILASCRSFGGMSCISPSLYDRNMAQSYYDSFSSYRADAETTERLRKIKEFQCEYRFGDRFYVYKTFIDTKYILVRYGTAITYIEE
jgi:hypothetical protein